MRDGNEFEFNIRFCEEVEQYPCLYDHSRPDYCIRIVQEQAWQRIADTFDVKAVDCKERWKNLRGRYTKYKRQIELSSGSDVKKIKQYYLADHLQFSDPFLKSRKGKGKLFTAVEATVKEEESCDGNLIEGTIEEWDATQCFTEDASHLTANEMTKPCSPLPTSASRGRNYRGCRKKARLSEVNSSASRNFETEQRLLDQEPQQSNSTKPDPDMAFLHSILPDMKAMDARQKRKFKMGVMQLVDETLTKNSL